MTGPWLTSRACCQSCFLLKYHFFMNVKLITTNAALNNHAFLRSRTGGSVPATHKFAFQSKFKISTISVTNENDEKEKEMSEESAALILEHKTMMKKSKKRLTDGVYILYPHIADYISRHLTGCDDHSDRGPNDTKMFIEVNPGLGIVTKALLRDGVSKLKLLESNTEFISVLERLRDESSVGSFEVVEKDFFKLPKLFYVDKITFSDNLDRLFDGVQTKNWIESPPLVVFATVPQKYEVKFMRYLLVSLAHLNGMFVYGRVQFVFFVSGKEYDYMISEPSKGAGRYRMASVLYSAFFDIDLLEKEKTKYFYPEPTKSKRMRIKYDQDHLYLVRLTPKSDLLSNFSSKEHLLEFYYFVKQHMVKRTAVVIYSLEKWIPNSGPRLIKEGYTIFTRFGDLSPQQFLRLFIQFSSWPEYADSQFRSMLFKSDHLDDHDDEDDEHDVEI